jgi:hypothetical protein
MTLGWEVGGDGYGEEPHSLNGEITLLYPLRWINLDTSSGSLDAGQSQEIIVNFDSSEIDEGLHCGNIVITCDSWDTKIIPVTLNVFQVDDDNELIPESFKLIGNFPNPFNPETEILFRLPDNSQVSLKIYNIKGQMIRSFKITEANSGINSVIWDGNNQKGEPVSSGVYFYKLKSGGKEISRKMILLK